jgi:bacterioferritin-associated ferredoxin
VIVCHCKAISDRTIRGVIRRGADSTREIARACGAGRVCGGCRPAIREVLQHERTSESCAPGVEESAALCVEATLVAAG